MTIFWKDYFNQERFEKGKLEIDFEKEDKKRKEKRKRKGKREKKEDFEGADFKGGGTP